MILRKGLAEKIQDAEKHELIVVEASRLEDNFTNALKKDSRKPICSRFLAIKQPYFSVCWGFFMKDFYRLILRNSAGM